MKHKAIFTTFIIFSTFLSILIILAVVPASAQKKRVKAPNKAKTIDFSKKYVSDWIFYGSSRSNNYYYDPAKATRTGSLVRVWTIGRDEATDEKVSTIWYEVNCDSNKIRSLAGVEYPRKNVIYVGRRTSWDTPKAKFDVIFPESVGEALKEEVCTL